MTSSQQTGDGSNADCIPEDRELDLDAYVQKFNPDKRIQKLSREIAFTVLELIQYWSRTTPFVIHVKSTQGTGKSLGNMETVAINIGPVAVFGPRHEDLKQDADHPALRSLFEVHFEGKDSACTNEKYENRHHRVNPDVSADWCRNCPERPDCTYFDPYTILNQRGFATGPDTSDKEWTEYLKANPDWSDEGLRGYTAAHQMLPHHPEVLDQWGAIEAVLIDESPWEAIGEQTDTLPLSDIRQAKGATRRLQDTEWADELPVDVLSELQVGLEILEELVDGDSDDHEGVYNQWLKLAVTCEEKGIIEALERAVSRERESKGESGTTLVVGPLLKALPSIREHTDRAWEEYQTLVNQRPPKAFWRVESDSLRLRWMDTATLNEIASEKPVCVLATEMSSDLVSAMFDLPVVTITDNVAPKADILQMDSYDAGITVLRERGKLWEDMLDLTELALRRERLAGNKAFIAVKQELLERGEDDPNAQPGVVEHMEERGFKRGVDFLIGNYYGLTGSNRFEECDAVVLFGKPRLPDRVADYKAMLSGLQAKNFHSKNTEGELRDALHRIRPARKDGVRAYILTDAVDFEDEFTGDYQPGGVPDLRRNLSNDIKQVKERREMQAAIIKFVREYNGSPTATKITNTLSGSGRKIKGYRDEMVEDGVLEAIKKVDGAGRPTKRYRVSEPITN